MLINIEYKARVLAFLLVFLSFILFAFIGFIQFAEGVSEKVVGLYEKQQEKCFDEQGKYNGKCDRW